MYELANKKMKMFSTAFVIREFQIKTIKRFQDTPTISTNLKKKKRTKNIKH